MAMEKSLYAAPQGLDMGEDMGVPPLEIEIENPDAVRLGIGDVEIDLMPGGEDKDDEEFNANLADDMDEQELQTLASELIGDFDDDEIGRAHV